MKSSVIAVIVVIVIVAAGGVYLWHNSEMQEYASGQDSDAGTSSAAPMIPADTSAQPQQQTGAQTQTSASVSGDTSINASASASAGTPAPMSFTVNGNDNSADLTQISVPKGTPVTITFGADADDTYHGGLDFRSSVVNTGTITPGSTKTVTFTAEQSFKFTPYWPSTNIAKPYTINITVE